MNTHHFDFSICKSVVFIATLAAFGFASNPAAARTFPIKHVTFANLAKACAKAGGTTYSGAGGSYGCAAGCKGGGDAGNNTCSVECQNGHCTGTTPGRTQPGDSALHVLTNSPGLAATPGSPSPAKSGGLLGDGILGGGMGLGTTGPAATGAPGSTGRGSPAAAPIQLR
jgi:hypothetical protein